jgi:hypothetical protein
MCLENESEDIWLDVSEHQASLGRYFVTNDSEDAFKRVGESYSNNKYYKSTAKLGYLACGIQRTIQANQGNLDDSSIVQISMFYCDVNNWDQNYFDYMNDFKEFTGLSGRTITCDKNEYIFDVQAQHVPYKGDNFDDTALNGIKIYCAPLKGGWNYRDPKVVFEGNGNWSQKPVSEQGMFVCEAAVGYDQDGNDFDGKKQADRKGILELWVKLCSAWQIS